MMKPFNGYTEWDAYGYILMSFLFQHAAYVQKREKFDTEIRSDEVILLFPLLKTIILS